MLQFTEYNSSLELNVTLVYKMNNILSEKFSMLSFSAEKFSMLSFADSNKNLCSIGCLQLKILAGAADLLKESKLFECINLAMLVVLRKF